MWKWFLLIAALVVWGGTARAMTAREILDHAKQLNQTTRKWNDRTQELALHIIDRRGGERDRKVKVYYKKYGDDRAKSILFFLSPPEVKDTGFLQWVDPHSHNQQWLYLPALKRVRQISGTGQRESFMGTDFSFEDLAIVTEILDWSDRDASATVEKEDSCGEGDHCWVLVFVPKEKDVAYARIRLWLDSQYRTHRFQFLDDKGEIVKQLEATDIRSVNGIPTAFRLDMKNVRAGSHTVVDFEDVKFDTGLEDRMFTEHQLEKGP